MKKFKAESQRVLEMMINSIYTHKEIFLRELLSNASDALDKLYYKSLTENLGLNRENLEINVSVDNVARTLTISDNGIGMSEDELDNNLGVIAKSGSSDFKANVQEGTEDVNIIGQFGVGFYSAFMVADKVTVLSKKYGEDVAHLWSSNGVAGYTITPAEKTSNGTIITLFLKADTDEEKYGEYLEEYTLKDLVKRYSDYIKYPIKMECSVTEFGKDDTQEPVSHTETQTLNSMVPIWKKNKSELKDEDYYEFYKSTFADYQNPIKYIHTSVEGAVDYKAVLFIPARAPYNYYSKDFEKGLRLYTNNVLISVNCKELLPDYFSFVKGLVESELSLNVSRETIQQNTQLKKIAVNIEKKIKTALEDMLANDRENYEKFFKEFGTQLKWGVYADWGAHKDELKDLLIFESVKEDKMITLKEYVSKMTDAQKNIYYAAGIGKDAIKVLPQTEKILDDGFDILCLTDNIDEFCIKILMNYDGKDFKSISDSDFNDSVATEETDKDKTLLEAIKNALGDKVSKVKLSERLKSHPVCLSSEGELSIEMEKVLNSIPKGSGTGAKAQKVLEINPKHPIYAKMSTVIDTDKDKIADYANVLFAQAQLIEGLPVENPAEISDIICNLLAE